MATKHEGTDRTILMEDSFLSWTQEMIPISQTLTISYGKTFSLSERRLEADRI